jgi:hypothetical protein
MTYLFSAAIVFGAYILICKVWPFVLYPNYLRKSKIEEYTELRELASRLKSADKFQAIENVYAYMQSMYAGHEHVREPRSLLSLLQLGDFSTHKVLNNRQFLWCHTQNRLLKSILVNTGMFREDEIIIERELWGSIFIHQWVSIELNGKRIKMDPYYGVFEITQV